MHADPSGVLTGVHFFDGDYACCEGALAAGARIRELSQGLTLGGLKIRELIDEGRP